MGKSEIRANEESSIDTDMGGKNGLSPESTVGQVNFVPQTKDGGSLG